MSPKNMDTKKLSELTKNQMLMLPNMSIYRNLPVKEIRAKMNEFSRHYQLKRGATVQDFKEKVLTIPALGPEDPDYKKVDDELFKNLKKNVNKKYVDRTDYSNIKIGKKSWLDRYKKYIDNGVGIQISITNNDEQIEAFNSLLTYLYTQTFQNKMIMLVGKNVEGQTKSIPVHLKNADDLEKITVDMVSHKIKMPEQVSDGQVEIDESSFFLADTLRIDVYKTTKKGNKRTIKKKTAIIPSDNNNEIVEIIDLDEEFETKDIRNGAFWAYLNKTQIDLSRYQIFNTLDKNNYVDNCLIYAFKQSGLYEDKLIETLIHAIKVRNVPMVAVKKLSEEFKIPIKIVEYTNVPKARVDTSKQYPDKKVLELLLYKNHYMLNEELPIAPYYLKNVEKLDELFKDMPLEKRCKISRLDVNNKIKEYKNTPTKLSLILTTMFENDLFEPIRNMEEIIRIGVENNNDLEDYVELDFDSELCCRIIDSDKYASKIKDNTFSGGIYYSDFETDTTTSPHTPYLNITIGGLENKSMAFYGDNIGKNLVNYLPNNSLVYFHNLKYDACFFMNESDDYSCKIIQRNGQIIQLVIKTFKPEKKVITFRDSYSLIPAKLAKFNEMFGLDVHKEVMAYKLYTKANRLRKIIPISEYFEQLAIENDLLTTEKYAKLLLKDPENKELLAKYDKIKKLEDQLLANAKIINNCYNEADNTIDIMRYAMYYCMLDCKVLKAGMEKFNKDIEQVFKDNGVEKYPGLYNFLSISSVGYNLAKIYGCFDGCYELTGKPQHFIQRSVNGGRTMTRNNEKLIVKDAQIADLGQSPKETMKIADLGQSPKETMKIADFDAVSLYPSAMSIMPGIPKGTPKIISKTAMKNKDIFKYDDFYVEIDINKVVCKSANPYNFGLIPIVDEDTGSKIYGNKPCENMVVDKRTLLDLLEYYDINYTIKRGYYFNEGFNNKINTFITGLFNLRLKYKKEKNPLQNTIKLLLNSIYGKSILKPIYVEIKSIPNWRLPRFIVRYYNYIHSMEGNRYRTYVKKFKPINRHFNLPQFGASVLSWSKYLMNRVICTAEQNNIDIFYQDTDSMHILEKDIETLANLFKNKYNMDLIGSKLTQFHSDFDSIATDNDLEDFFNKNPNVDKSSFEYKVWSTKLIALGKKSYLDILQDNIGKTGYHIRLKGIPNKCILKYCEKNNMSVEELYMKLYNGESVVFNILEGTPGFKKTATFEQINRQEFLRKVSF